MTSKAQERTMSERVAEVLTRARHPLKREWTVNLRQDEAATRASYASLLDAFFLAADDCSVLVGEVARLETRAEAAERELDALRDVLGAARYLIQADTRLRLKQIDAERVAARDSAWRGLCGTVARCNPDNSTATALEGARR